MNCERCGERPAAIRYTEYSEGEAQKLQICVECAASLGFQVDVEAGDAAGEAPTGEAPPVGKVLGVVGIEGKISSGAEGSAEADAARCPGCGIGGAELRTQTLLGCPTCYETFGRLLDGLLRKMHGATRHEGRTAGGGRAEPVDVEDLRRELEEAIARQDFEEAARVRDRLRRAVGGEGSE